MTNVNKDRNKLKSSQDRVIQEMEEEMYHKYVSERRIKVKFLLQEYAMNNDQNKKIITQ